MRRITAEGGTPGLVCLVNGVPRGWCALGSCRLYPAYSYPPYNESVAPDDWAIPCIYVAPEARGTGVGDAMVEFAKEYAAQRGASVLHGPPQWWKAREESEDGAVSRLLRRRGFERMGPGQRIPMFRCHLGESQQ